MSRGWQCFPVRRRVALVLSSVLALLLVTAGGVIYARTRSGLDAAINQGLRSRAADLTALVREADTGLAQAGRSAAGGSGNGFAQILTSNGRVIDAPPSLRRAHLLSRSQVAVASRHDLLLQHVRSPTGDGHLRLLAGPVDAQGQRLIVVAGTPLAQRDEALAGLGTLLLTVGAATLVLASLAGYVAVGQALRPVARMSARARGIQTGSLQQRLPVPPSGDELTQLGETLNAMLDRLQSGFARERAFVDDASHELRTPITILRGELELALRDGRTVEDFRDAIGTAGEEADRVASLAENLLVLARADQGQLVMAGDAREVREILDEVAARFAHRATRLGANVTVDGSADAAIAVDQDAIVRALSNLVDNALRYGATSVRLAASSGDCVALRVIDNGWGLPDEFLPRAFERFTRADAARGRGGSGLGLAIVAAIAAAHGGSAVIRNRPDGGAEATISLPQHAKRMRPPAARAPGAA